MLEHVPCNLCGSDKPIVKYPSRRAGAVIVQPNQFRSSGDEPLQDPLVKCSVCGFEYVTPRLNAAAVMEGYTNAVDETFVSQAKGREATFTRCLSTVQRVWKKAPGRILDVGTANGSFLKIAKDTGWDVAGCEPNRWMCRWCEGNYGLRITAGTIFDGKYGSEEFDVVTLWDVLEHTPDPMATLQECCRVLRPGGLLVVNYPDIGSWIARLMGHKWVFLLSVHYFYFTRQTMKQALERNGLRILRMNPHVQTLELDYILFRSTAYIGIVGTIFRRFFGLLRLGQIHIPYWIGQTLVVAMK
jgi:SAM-dependent methyltransferase